MKVDLCCIRPNADLQKWEAQFEFALVGVSAVAVLVDNGPNRETLTRIARALMRSDDVRLVSVWGDASETLHDQVDQAALERRAFGPVTTWQNDCTIEQFLWNFAFVYRGVLEIDDQGRGNLVCYVSDQVPLPERVLRAFESAKDGTLKLPDDA